MLILDPEFPLRLNCFRSCDRKNAVNLLALSLNEHGQTPTRFQLKTYPILGPVSESI